MSKYQALYAEKANIGFEAGICTQDLKWQVIQPNIFFFLKFLLPAVWNNQIHPPVQTLGKTFTVKTSLWTEISKNGSCALLATI